MKMPRFYLNIARLGCHWAMIEINTDDPKEAAARANFIRLSMGDRNFTYDLTEWRDTGTIVEAF